MKQKIICPSCHQEQNQFLGRINSTYTTSQFVVKCDICGQKLLIKKNNGEIIVGKGDRKCGR